MKLAIGSDHAGFELKEIVKSYLQEKGNELTIQVQSHKKFYQKELSAMKTLPETFLGTTESVHFF